MRGWSQLRKRHPRSVRTATLLGVVPPDARYPLGLARFTQQALDGLIAECEGDPACHGAFPRLRQELDAVFRRVSTKPARVELVDPAGGKPFEVRLGPMGVAQALRYMLYSPSEAALLPLLVHEAAGGNFEPLAQTARLFASFLSSTSDGFYQSVTCAEDVAFIRDDEIPAAVAGTFLGDFRIRRQVAACQEWPAAKLGPDFLQPVMSGVPVLALSGERDARAACNGCVGRSRQRRHAPLARGIDPAFRRVAPGRERMVSLGRPLPDHRIRSDPLRPVARAEARKLGLLRRPESGVLEHHVGFSAQFAFEWPRALDASGASCAHGGFGVVE